MKRAGTGPAAADVNSSYPVLVLLLVAFLLPTVCLVWFMTEAMRNERLAVRQKLVDAYTSALNMAMPQADSVIQSFIHVVRKELSSGAVPHNIPALLNIMECDSVVLVGAEGTINYPDSAATRKNGGAPASLSWIEAMHYETEVSAYDLAASAYARVAAEPTMDSTTRARALQAQARCHLSDRNSTAAVSVLTGPLCDPACSTAQDSEGRLIQPSAWLLALETIKDPRDPRFVQTMRQLTARLIDYRAWMPASQRLFLMESCERLVPGRNAFPTLRAERLARAWADAGDTTGLSLAEIPVTVRNGIWAVRATPREHDNPTTQAIALFRTETLCGMIAKAVGSKLPKGLRVEVFAPENSGPQPTPRSGVRRHPVEPLLISRFGDALPGWSAALYTTGMPVDDYTGNRVSLYLWIGLLAVTSVAAIVLIGGRILLRQVRLTRLKNDLTATVTHELKTPISSMRVLVDALRENPGCGEQQLQEYLDLIARENSRLSRLIDNFLTFSRMERNKHGFEFSAVSAKELVETALAAAGEKLTRPGCSLESSVDDPLPQVSGDRDALVTVLLNLLENAYKYTGDDKHICVRAYGRDGQVCLEVRDNGIGIPSRARKRIFERFYQVDQSLSRTAGGCGLGLSIVEFIVKAHRGNISVESEPGCGSAFVVWLPAIAEDLNRKEAN